MNVYAIKSRLSGRIYVGHTRDIDVRSYYHNSGYVKTTRHEGPWELIAVEQFEDRESARWKERQLKQSKGTRAKWIQQNSVL